MSQRIQLSPSYLQTKASVSTSLNAASCFGIIRCHDVTWKVKHWHLSFLKQPIHEFKCAKKKFSLQCLKGNWWEMKILPWLAHHQVVQLLLFNYLFIFGTQMKIVLKRFESFLTPATFCRCSRTTWGWEIHCQIFRFSRTLMHFQNRIALFSKPCLH